MIGKIAYILMNKITLQVLGKVVCSHIEILLETFLTVFKSPSPIRNINTHRFFDLSFEGFDLVLQLVDKVLESLLVFPVFIRLESEFLEPAISFAHAL